MTHIAKNLVAYVMALPVIYQPQYFFFDSPMHHLKYFLSETGGVQRWQQERGNAFQNNPTQCNAMIRSLRQPTIYNLQSYEKQSKAEIHELKSTGSVQQNKKTTTTKTMPLPSFSCVFSSGLYLGCLLYTSPSPRDS